MIVCAYPDLEKRDRLVYATQVPDASGAWDRQALNHKQKALKRHRPLSGAFFVPAIYDGARVDVERHAGVTPSAPGSWRTMRRTVAPSQSPTRRDGTALKKVSVMLRLFSAQRWMQTQ